MARKMAFLVEAKERQDSLIALCTYFTLGRGCEVFQLLVGDIQIKEDHLVVDLDRNKGGVTTLPYRVQGGRTNVVELYKKHLELLKESYGEAFGKEVRLWHGFITSKQRFKRAPIGRNYIADLAKKIADYLELPQDGGIVFSGHSFRRTAATQMVNSGATELDLTVESGIVQQIQRLLVDILPSQLLLNNEEPLC